MRHPPIYRVRPTFIEFVMGIIFLSIIGTITIMVLVVILWLMSLLYLGVMT